jgi:hypothetical protein
VKHAHGHRHEDGTEHGHFHEHDEAAGPFGRDAEGRKAHKAAPHIHEHRTRQVTIPVTFDVGALEDIGLGGFKVSWLDAEQDGRTYSLTAGAGVGSPYLEASVTGGGQPGAYARADIRKLASVLWDALRAAQADEAVLAQEPEQASAAPALPVLRPGELELLRSYESGPKIWDAAVLAPSVSDLAGKGLIEPVPDFNTERPGVYQLTPAGRAVLVREER